MLETSAQRKRRAILTLSLVLTMMLLTTPLIYSSVAAIPLPPVPPGFNFRSYGGWDKTTDLAPVAQSYIDYVKNNFGVDLPAIPAGTHLWVYSVYINQSGSQTFYAGFINYTSSSTSFTMPEQLIVQHFTTRRGEDAIFAASFSMLMISNISGPTYGSFTLGKESVLQQLNAIEGSIPTSPITSASIIPLTHSIDNESWSWGMSYNNLVTIWWRMFFNNGSCLSLPYAIITLDELTFVYNMTILPPGYPLDAPRGLGNITTRVDYTIGSVSNLWLMDYAPDGKTLDHIDHPMPASTSLNDMRISLLQHLRTSVYGKPLLADSDGTKVRNQSVDVSTSAISGKVDDELIYLADFGRKKDYGLYEGGIGPTTYQALTKTYPFKGIVDNSIFNDTGGVYRMIQRIVSYVPQFFDAKGRGFEVTQADADVIYMITYPNWRGDKIVHDPYFAVLTGIGGIFGSSTVIVLLIALSGLVVATAVLFVRTKATK